MACDKLSWSFVCLKNKTSVPSCCSELTQCLGVCCHGSTTNQRAFRASYINITAVKCKLHIRFSSSGNKSRLFSISETIIHFYFPNKSFKKKKHAWVSQTPVGMKSKTLQCSEQYGLIVEAKWISCLDSLILQRIYQGRSNYICLIVVQARTEHLIKTPCFCLPELIIHSSKLPSALK